MPTLLEQVQDEVLEAVVGYLDVSDGRYATSAEHLHPDPLGVDEAETVAHLHRATAPLVGDVQCRHAIDGTRVVSGGRGVLRFPGPGSNAPVPTRNLTVNQVVAGSSPVMG